MTNYFLLMCSIACAYIGVGESMSLFRDEAQRNFYVTYAHGVIAALLLLSFFSGVGRSNFHGELRARGYPLKCPFPLLVFFVYMVGSSLIWVSVGTAVDLYKLGQVVMLNGLYLAILPRVLAGLRLEHVLRIVVWIGAAIGIASFAQLFHTGYRASITAAGHSNSVPVVSALAILLFGAVQSRKGATDWFGFLLLILLGLVTIGSNSRAALVALAVVVCFGIIALLLQLLSASSTQNSSATKLLAVIAAGFAVTVGLSMLSQRFSYAATRFELFSDFLGGGSRDTSLARRAWYLEEFVAYAPGTSAGEYCFGVGLGNYAMSVGESEYVYPHNLFLESFVELGLVGAVLLALCFAYSCFHIGVLWWRGRVTQALFLLAILTIYGIYCSSYGDLCQHRYLFLWFFLCGNLPILAPCRETKRRGEASLVRGSHRTDHLLRPRPGVVSGSTNGGSRVGGLCR